MSGETEADPSGWTPDQLAQHFNRVLGEMDRRYEQRFVAQEKAVSDALASAEKAVDKALAENDKRLTGMNEFRDTLRDQAATFMPRTESTARWQAVSDRVDELKARVDLDQGRSSGSDRVIGAAAAVLTIVIALSTVVILIVNN